MAVPQEVNFSTSFPAAQTRSEVEKCRKVIWYEVRAIGPKKKKKAKYIKLTKSRCKTCGNDNADTTEMFHDTHMTPLGGVGVAERAAEAQLSKLPATGQPVQVKRKALQPSTVITCLLLHVLAF